MKKKKMYSLISPYKCKLCGQDMLFFVTASNTLIDYKAFILQARSLEETKMYLEKRNIRYIKCVCCDKYFIIDWSNGWPEQLLDRNILNTFGIK